jgi:hypothetical protein
LVNVKKTAPPRGGSRRGGCMAGAFHDEPWILASHGVATHVANLLRSHYAEGAAVVRYSVIRSRSLSFVSRMTSR